MSVIPSFLFLALEPGLKFQYYIQYYQIFLGKNINVCKLKAMLHSVRQKTYTFLPLWKILLILIFVYALVPNFRLQIQRMDFKTRADAMSGESINCYVTVV